MEIIPRQGTDAVKFGMGGGEVEGLLGAPDAVTPLSDQPGYPRGRESWSYRQLDILMAGTDGVIAVTVECAGAEVRLWDQNVTGCNPARLTELLQQAGEAAETGEADQWGDFDITAPGAGLVFYFSEDGLMSVEVQKPNWRRRKQFVP